MRTILRLACVLLVVAASGQALAGKPVTERERFDLWHDCTPVGLEVVVPTETQELTGLSKDEIETTARGKLQGARLHTPEATVGILAITVESVELPFTLSLWRVVARLFDQGAVFLIRVQFLKWMDDPLSDEDVLYRAGTWSRTHFGSFEDKSDTWLLSIISDYMDEFIADYIRVNAAGCNTEQR